MGRILAAGKLEQPHKLLRLAAVALAVIRFLEIPQNTTLVPRKNKRRVYLQQCVLVTLNIETLPVFRNLIDALRHTLRQQAIA